MPKLLKYPVASDPGCHAVIMAFVVNQADLWCPPTLGACKT
jgi:hypothetical protein